MERRPALLSHQTADIDPLIGERPDQISPHEVIAHLTGLPDGRAQLHQGDRGIGGASARDHPLRIDEAKTVRPWQLRYRYHRIHRHDPQGQN